MSLPERPTSGALIFSIDLELQLDQLASEHVPALVDVTGQLIDLCRRHELSATWAVAEPTESATVRRLARGTIPHEIAILGDPTWVGSKSGRLRFAQELSRRAQSARAAGFSVSSLIPGESALDDHLDLVVKHGLTAVRGMVDLDGRVRCPAQPHALHYGLWEVPGSLRLPGQSRLMPGGGLGLRARHGIDQAIAAGHFYHLVIDVPRLAMGGRTALGTLERTLRHVDRRRRSGKLEVITMATAAARLSQTPSITPARSILRPAG